MILIGIVFLVYVVTGAIVFTILDTDGAFLKYVDKHRMGLVVLMLWPYVVWIGTFREA
jgi:hypothetical protein